MTHAEYADGLRRIADWYEQHSEVPLPHDVPRFSVVPGNDAARTVAKALGRADKRFDGDLFYLSRPFGTLRLDFVFNREAVCRSRVVGTRLIPARPAVPEHEVEMIEWDCHAILDGGPDES